MRTYTFHDGDIFCYNPTTNLIYFKHFSKLIKKDCNCDVCIAASLCKLVSIMPAHWFFR